jgi:predicted DNA binding CopG/RHH family protein
MGSDDAKQQRSKDLMTAGHEFAEAAAEYERAAQRLNMAVNRLCEVLMKAEAAVLGLAEPDGGIDRN